MPECLYCAFNASLSQRKKSARLALFRHNDVYQTALHKMENIGLETYYSSSLKSSAGVLLRVCIGKNYTHECRTGLLSLILLW